MTDDEIIRRMLARPAVLGVALAPASAEAVAGAEAALGHPLPELLRRIYLEVADGGVGPGFGLLRLEALVKENGYPSLDDPDQPDPPAGMLFLVDWGCADWTMIDCRDPRGAMWAWEEGDRWALGWDLATWLKAWLRGRSLVPWDLHDVRQVGHPDEWFHPEEDDDDPGEDGNA